MSEDRIETTDAFDSLPLDIYVSCVLDRTRVLAGFVHPEFWSDQRINRVKNRWLNRERTTSSGDSSISIEE